MWRVPKQAQCIHCFKLMGLFQEVVGQEVGPRERKEVPRDTTLKVHNPFLAFCFSGQDTDCCALLYPGCHND